MDMFGDLISALDRRRKGMMAQRPASREKAAEPEVASNNIAPLPPDVPDDAQSVTSAAPAARPKQLPPPRLPSDDDDDFGDDDGDDANWDE